MKIYKITGQNRRDFQAIYICEHCGEKESGYGYDDANFHENVIPNKVCKHCGKTAGDEYKPQATKYPEGFQV